VLSPYVLGASAFAVKVPRTVGASKVWRDRAERSIQVGLQILMGEHIIVRECVLQWTVKRREQKKVVEYEQRRSHVTAW
jgi:hypothetical protein